MILAASPIVLHPLRSGRRVISNRVGFSRSLQPLQTPRNPMSNVSPLTASGQIRMIVRISRTVRIDKTGSKIASAKGRLGKNVRLATDFAMVARTAMVGPATFVRFATLLGQPNRESGPEAPASAPELPSFITGTPRPNVPEAEGLPSAVGEPSQPSGAPAEALISEDALAEGRFPGRGRRRRLRSPYGFNVAQNQGDGDDQSEPIKDEAPIRDDSPITE